MEDSNHNQPPTQTPTPVEQTVGDSPSPEKPKSKLKLVIIIVAIIIGFLILLTGGFFAINSYIRTEELKPNEPVTKAPILSPTPDPTADWKTYTNPDGYSYKYPSTWFNHELVNPTPSYPVGGGRSNGIYITVVPKPVNRTLQQFVQQKIDEANTNINPPAVKTLDKPSYLSNVDAVLTNGFPGAGIEVLRVFIGNGDLIYVIAFEGMDEALADKILSTFKFTDQNSTSACIPEPSICKNQLVGAYPKECVEPTEGWCP